MKIFLCSPYSHKDKYLVEHRVKQINQAAAKLMRDGHIVFSPISHSHYIAMQEDLPKAFEWWVRQNHAFIEWCEAVYVLALDGWKESVGVKDEICYAIEIGRYVVGMVAV